MEKSTNFYRGLRPDAFTDWTTRIWIKEVGDDLAIQCMDLEREKAVDARKKGLRDYRKKLKAQEPSTVELILLTIEPEPPDVEDI